MSAHVEDGGIVRTEDEKVPNRLWGLWSLALSALMSQPMEPRRFELLTS
jgi:hypothetical protein